MEISLIFILFLFRVWTVLIREELEHFLDCLGVWGLLAWCGLLGLVVEKGKDFVDDLPI